jgi:hypothetical protein
VSGSRADSTSGAAWRAFGDWLHANAGGDWESESGPRDGECESGGSDRESESGSCGRESRSARGELLGLALVAYCNSLSQQGVSEVRISTGAR